ncbi:alpha/beta hydrolase [Oleiharenicola lentus]|uniref:alpha/beta hydrolase n=1 Tax=Oleiharenicola lentus TaxID=2508720 RepID=UPI003F67789E
MKTFSYLHRYEPGTDESAQPLLLLHGTGGNEHDLVPLAQQLSPGSAILSPRGDVLENGAPRFFRRLAEGVFDLDEVAQRTHALADFITAASGRYGIAPGTLTAIGFSNGANIAASLLLLRPETLARAVLLRPMVVLTPKSTPSLAGKSILISSGQMDPIVPPDHPERLAKQFREAGAQVELHTHTASHGLVRDDFAVTASFLRRAH